MPTKAQNKATAKYKKANYKRIPLEIPIDQFDVIKVAADAAGESVNGYIREAIRQRMESEGNETDAGPAEMTREAKTERTPIKL